MVETDINKRWEDGTPHHPKSEELFEALSEIDYEHGGDYFGWKAGGDGDNGEHLMYEMDIYFETLDENALLGEVLAAGFEDACAEGLANVPVANAEREAFEVWYASDATAKTGETYTPQEIAKLRDGAGYGAHRVMLNGKWEGWQARAK